MFLPTYERITGEVRETVAQAAALMAMEGHATIASFMLHLVHHRVLDREWYVLDAEFTLYAIRNPQAGLMIAARHRHLREMIGAAAEEALLAGGCQLDVHPDLFTRALLGLVHARLGQCLPDQKRPIKPFSSKSLCRILSPAVHLELW